MVAKTYQYDANNNLIAPLNASVVAKAESYKTGKEKRQIKQTLKLEI